MDDLLASNNYTNGPSSIMLFCVKSSEDRKLLKVLKKASMGDRTVVLTILSPEWARPGSVFDLFLESFRFGQGTKPFLNNLVVFTVDGQSLQYCKSIHLYCFSVANHGFNNAFWKPFRDLQHLKLGWRKIELIEEVFRLGYNIISPDADVMWFRNPFQHFHHNCEMIAAQDSCSDTLESKSSKTEGGFFFLKANEISLEFMKYWGMVRALNPTSSDQFAFENIKNDDISEILGLRIQYLERDYFGCLCQPSKDMNKICTMHAKCYNSTDLKVYTSELCLISGKAS